jgi:hypothetical protein
MASKKTRKTLKKSKKLNVTKTLTKLPVHFPPVPCVS